MTRPKDRQTCRRTQHGAVTDYHKGTSKGSLRSNRTAPGTGGMSEPSGTSVSHWLPMIVLLEFCAHRRDWRHAVAPPTGTARYSSAPLCDKHKMCMSKCTRLVPRQDHRDVEQSPLARAARAGRGRPRCVLQLAGPRHTPRAPRGAARPPAAAGGAGGVPCRTPRPVKAPIRALGTCQMHDLTE